MDKRALALGALVLLFAPAPRALGASGLEPPDPSRYLRWGPLRARPGLELSNLGYDDNILSENDPRVGDYTATLSPRLEGLLLFGHRAFVTFDERLDLTGYLHNGSQNFANQRGRGRLTVPFRRIGVFTDFVLNRVKERPVDREDLRPARRETGSSLGLILKPGSRTELELGRSGTAWRYSDPDFSAGEQTIGERLDRRETHDRLRVSYRLLGRTRLTLDAGREAIDFENLTSEGRSKNSRTQKLLAGVDFGEGGSLSGTARLGWTSIDSQDPALTDFSAVVADTELAYRPSARTTFRLGALREPGLTVTGGSLYFVETRYRLRAIYYLNRVVGFETGTSRGTLTFPGSGGGAERRDRIIDYDLGLRLRLAENALGRRVEYALRAGRYRRDSSDDDLDLSRRTFGLAAVLGF